ncbi:MAG: hypothetical protein O7E52_21040, partial [Candidatus Poribacteria bacterium]|nr:hypothetical protein [Candidatus Poribacteria bacterium]
IDEFRVSKVIRYDGDFDPPEAPFEPDADTTALYHFDEVVGRATIANFAPVGPDGRLEGAAEIVAVDLPNTKRAVEAGGKLTTIWGKLKAR